MQKLVELRKRMRTVTTIRAVARTLATVSAAKLSRTRREAAGMRVYAAAMRRVLERQQAYLAGLSATQAAAVSPFFATRAPCRAVTLLHITGDRGMCGNYNQIANRTATAFVARRTAAGQPVAVVAKGLRGERYLRRSAGAHVIYAEGWPREGVTAEDAARLFDLLSGRFLRGETDEVWCLYTQFFSPLKRVPRLVRLLPVAPERLVGGATGAGPASKPPERWSYEPSLGAIIDEVLPVFLRLQLQDVLVESYASEQGARMVTMEEATERADKSLAEMRMRYNRMRREAITSDIVAVLFARQATGDAEVSDHDAA